ncbi:MAG: type II toxin-antitoxin system RelE/ParE family toxin [Planctomycetes bacterium]|nr:type II toxin-antitoxin system RelE/ParE family toxin [Planctomycetota bacterium]
MVLGMDLKVSPEAMEDIERLTPVIHTRVTWILERLRDWPRVSGAKPLRGQLAGHYRIRTGDYRMQFRIERGTVIVERIGHRSRFYEE